MASSNESAHGIYFLAVKSSVDNMDQFLTSMDINNVAIDDEALIQRFQNMSKTLQRILSKSNKNKKANASLVSSSTPDQVFKEQSAIMKSEFSLNSKKLDEKEISSDDELSEQQKSIIKKTRQKVSDIVGDSSDDEENISTDDNFELKSPKKSKLDNVVPAKEELKIDTEEIIKKLSYDAYHCTICNVTLPKNNVVSHENGRSHKNMREKRMKSLNTSRESSVTRDHTDISVILEGIDKKCTENESGQTYITTGQSYVCILCKAEMTNESCLKQHLAGYKHKRLAGVE